MRDKTKISPDIKSKIRQLPAKAGSELALKRDHFDENFGGFGFRVHSNGEASYFFFGRVGGLATKNQRLVTLGPVKTQGSTQGLTYEEAKDEAHAIRKRLREGWDPKAKREEARAARVAPTIVPEPDAARTYSAVAEDFVRNYKRFDDVPLKPRTRALYAATAQSKHLAEWNNRDIASITRPDVIAMIESIKRKGVPVQAQHTYRVLRLVFLWALNQGKIENLPTAAIKVGGRKSRDRHLFGSEESNRPSEIASFWNACSHVGTHGLVARLCLLTGARREEAAFGTRNEFVDLGKPENARWVLPAARAKNGRENVMPLCGLAIATVKAAPEFKGSDYIFTLNGRQPISMARSLSEMLAPWMPKNTQRFTLHDCRRTFETGLAELDVPQDVIDLLMNHKKKAMARIYNHSTKSAAKREAVNLWDSYIRKCVAELDAEKHKLAA